MISASEARNIVYNNESYSKTFMKIVETRIRESAEKGHYTHNIKLNNEEVSVFLFNYLTDYGYKVIREFCTDGSVKLHISWSMME